LNDHLDRLWLPLADDLRPTTNDFFENMITFGVLKDLAQCSEFPVSGFQFPE
jgi:hypothetical protein